MKPSEKRLLFAFLGILFLGGITLGSRFYFEKRDLLLTEKSTLENEWIEIETLFEEKEMWEMRSQWLDQNQPKFTNAEEVEQEIYKLAQAENIDGVTTSRQNLLPTSTTPDYVQAGVSLAASGDLDNVMRWLYDLNRSEAFQVVHNLKILPDKESPEKIIATFELLRWYAPATALPET